MADKLLQVSQDMRILLLIVACAFLVYGCGSHRAIRPGAKADPVVSVERQSRMFQVLSKQTGQPITPGVLIYADGTCRVRTFDGDELTKAIRPSKVRELLDFFQREGLFSISDESIDRHMKAVEPYRVVVVDASDTTIVARQDGKSVRISRYALDLEIQHYPEVPELRAVQKCVERVYETVGIKF